MQRTLLVSLIAFIAVGASVIAQRPPAQQPTPASDLAYFAPLSQKALLDQYCVTCHNERLKTGGLALETLPLNRLGETNAETWEKVVRKLRAGLMPPAGAKRPERGSLDAFAKSIEDSIDHFAASNPNPGRAPLHRMRCTWL